MKKKWVVISSTGILVIAIGTVAALFFFQPAKDLVKKVSSSISNEPQANCPIDGMPTTADVAEGKPLAIMIENLASIRPQNGLSRACIVFEALAEGGITRFLAIFNHQEVDRIGPVRSARPYYVALAAGFDAVYGHAGGSTVGVQKIAEYGVDDLDYSNMGAYWRQKGIRAPHNLFTSTTKFRSAAEKAGYEEVDYTGFNFSKKKLTGAPAKNIKINFSYGSYAVEYRYDVKTKKYMRFTGGLAHKDANNNKQIAPVNVVVVRAPTSMYNAITLKIDIIGTGDGYLFRDGVVKPITWTKEAADTQISFQDEKGQEIKFLPGQIWVEVVKEDTKVKIGD